MRVHMPFLYARVGGLILASLLMIAGVPLLGYVVLAVVAASFIISRMLHGIGIDYVDDGELFDFTEGHRERSMAILAKAEAEDLTYAEAAERLRPTIDPKAALREKMASLPKGGKLYQLTHRGGEAEPAPISAEDEALIASQKAGEQELEAALEDFDLDLDAPAPEPAAAEPAPLSAEDEAAIAEAARADVELEAALADFDLDEDEDEPARPA